MPDIFLYLLFAAMGVLVLLPPRFDPAIRWKEFNEIWREKLERERDGCH